MKKRIILSIAVLLGITLNVRALEITPGSLEQTLGPEAFTTRTLTLSGAADARDLAFLASLPQLTELDMSGLTIEKLESSVPVVMSRRYYPANTIPAFVFVLSNLEKVSLPGTLTDIEECAFASSSRLREISLGSSVRAIGDWAFYSTALTGITLPASVDTLGQGVFANCTALTTANLTAASLKELPAKSFRGCSALKTISFPASMLHIGDECLLGSGLETLALPSGVRTAGLFAMSQMPVLQTVNTGDATLGAGAFFGDSVLQKVEGSGVIPPLGFAACTGLVMDSTASAAIKSLGDYALADNAARILSFGDRLEYVGKNVFDGMSGLTTVHGFDMHGKIPATDEGAFNGLENEGNITLYVNKNFEEDWKNHPEWSRFTIIGTYAGVDAIGDDSVDNSGIACVWNVDVLTVSATGILKSVSVYDANGAVLAVSAPADSKVDIDLGGVQSQIIIVRAFTGNASKVFKLIRNN